MEVDELLITWYLHNKRDLPWRKTHDPYKIWLSEIILQQTRVAQGLSYYLQFTETYPTVGNLAKATEQEVLKLWQGLGYYSRARNLLSTAKYIENELDGEFPSTYEGLIALKGIGPYTAAAIASFSYNLPHAVIDGNVNRVLSRLFDVDLPMNSKEGMKVLKELANKCLSQKDPANYNQAIMELGALICTPQKPVCSDCPLQEKCLAYAHRNVLKRPVKIKKQTVRDRYLNYMVLETESEIIFKERKDNDIWKGLNDFSLIEDVAEPEEPYLRSEIKKRFPELIVETRPTAPAQEYIHKLSHQRIVAKFWKYKVSGSLPENSGFFKVEKSHIDSVAVPRLVHKFLEDQELI
jgi:A/G-specific adenine glycosylase